MANPTWATTLAANNDFTAFQVWLIKQFGFIYAAGLLDIDATNYRESPYYKMWVDHDKPDKAIPNLMKETPLYGPMDEPPAGLPPYKRPPEIQKTVPNNPARAGEYAVVVATLDDGKKYTLEGKYDDNGVFTLENNRGEVKTDDLGREQLDLQKQKWMSDIYSTSRQQGIDEAKLLSAQRSNSIARYNQQFMGRREEDILNQARAEQEAKFETWRSALMANGDPEQWMKKGMVANKPNPFAVPKGPEGIEQLGNVVKDWGQEVTNAGLALKSWQERATDNADQVDPGVITQAMNRLNNAITQRNAADDRYSQAKYEGQRAAAMGGPVPTDPMTASAYYAERRPTGVNGGYEMGGPAVGPSNEAWRAQYGPEVPSWLPQFVPGLAGKQFISGPAEVKQTNRGIPYGVGWDTGQYPITRPSGQSWLGMTPTQTSMLKGYADWTGQSWADILDQMAKERPSAAPVPSRTTARRQR